MNALKNYVLGICLFFTLFLSAQKQSNRINEYRVLGSHNSYKQAIEPPLLAILKKSADSARIKTLEYTHLSLTAQLDLGLRALEIDVTHDPLGGKYAHPMGLDLIKKSGSRTLPYDNEQKLLKPGMKVFHIQDIDFRSSQLLFVDALQEIKNWSKANPNHHPIFITVNAKDEIIDKPGFKRPILFEKKALDSIDVEIRSVFSENQLITPDKLRGNAKTLEQAVLTKGWPTLKEAKGKILFVFDEKGKKLEDYRDGHPSLQGRVMFISALEGEPEAAFMIINEAITDEAKIKKLVQKGYFVRTRSDADTNEARKGDYSRYEAALRSQAQIISTDYYMEGSPYGKPFRIFFKEQKL